LIFSALAEAGKNCQPRAIHIAAQSNGSRLNRYTVVHPYCGIQDYSSAHFLSMAKIEHRLTQSRTLQTGAPVLSDEGCDAIAAKAILHRRQNG
jgi:hypothetical protein